MCALSRQLSSLDGYMLVDKPSGMSSFDVIRKLKRIFPDKDPLARRAKHRRYKLGHTGTLDPIATGLLVVCVGEATKAVPWLTGVKKIYEVTARIGCTSDTYDSTGLVYSHPAPNIDVYNDSAEFSRAISSFLGKIKQRPPAYSAIHINGERAYHRARRGEAFEMPPRFVVIDSIDILDHSYDQFSLRVKCSSGTYIRSLVHDIGALLGTGAIMTALRRTRCGLFDIDDACELGQFEKLAGATKEINGWDANIIDISAGFPRGSVAEISTPDWKCLRQGRAIDPAQTVNFCLRRHNDCLQGDTQSQSFAIVCHRESGSAAFVVSAADGRWFPRRILDTAFVDLGH